VYYERSGGGVVFSVGSINWYPVLAWNGYNNNVATLALSMIKEIVRRSAGKTNRTQILTEK
jgi:N,N-dimethylformamidase